MQLLNQSLLVEEVTLFITLMSTVMEEKSESQFATRKVTQIVHITMMLESPVKSDVATEK